MNALRSGVYSPRLLAERAATIEAGLLAEPLAEALLRIALRDLAGLDALRDALDVELELGGVNRPDGEPRRHVGLRLRVNEKLTASMAACASMKVEPDSRTRAAVPETLSRTVARMHQLEDIAELDLARLDLPAYLFALVTTPDKRLSVATRRAARKLLQNIGRRSPSCNCHGTRHFDATDADAEVVEVRQRGYQADSIRDPRFAMVLRRVLDPECLEELQPETQQAIYETVGAEAARIIDGTPLRSEFVPVPPPAIDAQLLPFVDLVLRPDGTSPAEIFRALKALHEERVFASCRCPPKVDLELWADVLADEEFCDYLQQSVLAKPDVFLAMAVRDLGRHDFAGILARVHYPETYVVLRRQCDEAANSPVTAIRVVTDRTEEAPADSVSSAR